LNSSEKFKKTQAFPFLVLSGEGKGTTARRRKGRREGISF
jgi:hypothetical protein